MALVVLNAHDNTVNNENDNTRSTSQCRREMRDSDHKRGRQLVDCTTEEDTVAEETAGQYYKPPGLRDSALSHACDCC